MSFIDDATRMEEMKDQALEANEEFKAVTESQTGKKLKNLRNDNRREYVNSRFKASMARNGVRHQKTFPYILEQTGIAERMNRTILNQVRSTLNDANLPKRFWAEAVNTVVYLIKRSPTRRASGSTTRRDTRLSSAVTSSLLTRNSANSLPRQIQSNFVTIECSEWNEEVPARVIERNPVKS